jgi:hypothetical protein
MRRKRLFPEIVGGNDKDAIRIRIANVNHAQKSTIRGLPYRDSRSSAAGAVLIRTTHYISDFVLVHAMVVDIRQTRRRVEVESNLHQDQDRQELSRCATKRGRFRFARRNQRLIQRVGAKCLVLRVQLRRSSMFVDNH